MVLLRSKSPYSQKATYHMSWTKNLPLVYLIFCYSSQTHLISSKRPHKWYGKNVIEESIPIFYPFCLALYSLSLWVLRALVLVFLKKKGVFIKSCQHTKDKKGYCLLRSDYEFVPWVLLFIPYKQIGNLPFSFGTDSCSLWDQTCRLADVIHANKAEHRTG